MVVKRSPNYPLSRPSSGAEVKGVVAPCKGWIQINSHYLAYSLGAGDDIAVGYTAKLYAVEGKAERLVETIDVKYEDLKQDKVSAVGDAPKEAAKNGNPKVNIGGDSGYVSGKYKLTLEPKIAYGKVRLRKEPDGEGRYTILDTSGSDSKKQTDRYVQVTETPAVESSWSETFDLPCSPITSPKILEFVWADFNTWDGYTTARITGKGNIGGPGLDAGKECLEKIEKSMTDALGASWRTVAVTNAYFPLHPMIRHKAFVFINKTQELLGRKVRITNPGRSANFQKFLYERYVQCNGAAAAAPWKSNHQYGLAFDSGYGTSMTDAPADEADTQVRVADQVGLDWGGRWKTPHDPPHLEYPGASSRTTSYSDQLNKDPTTILTYEGHDYVRDP